MSPRPDRRPDSRPDRGGRRPAGGPPGRPPSRSGGRSGAPLRGGASRRPRWGPPEAGEAGDRPRPRRDAGQPLGEWTPRGRGEDGPAPRRFETPRFGDRRSDGGRPQERRWEGRTERPERPERSARTGRFERRPDAGRPPRPPASRPPEGPPGRFLSRSGARPRPPAELIGLERRGPAAGPKPSEGSDGEHFAAAAPSDLIWGRHSAQATLESGRPIHRIWCTPEMRFSPRFLQLLREAKAGGVLVEEVTWARLGQISGGAVHQGIVLQPAAAETLDLASLIDGCRSIGESPLLLAVDGLTDPQNLGAIVRSAEALGAHGLVLPQRRNAGLTGSVAKVAAGALEHLPVARVVNLNRSLEALKDEGYRVIGLASEGSVTLEEADLDGPLVLVTGSEGDGLSLLTRRHCDQLVRIPLRGTTPSLNASVATALLLYEIARRGWMQGLTGSSPAPRLVRPALPSAAAAAAEPSDATETADSQTSTDAPVSVVSPGSADPVAGTRPALASASADSSAPQGFAPSEIAAATRTGQADDAAPPLASSSDLPGDEFAGESLMPCQETPEPGSEADRSVGQSARDTNLAAAGGDATASFDAAWPGRSGEQGEPSQANPAASSGLQEPAADQPAAATPVSSEPTGFDVSELPASADAAPTSFDGDIRL